MKLKKDKAIFLHIDSELNFLIDSYICEHNEITKSGFIRTAIREKLISESAPRPSHDGKEVNPTQPVRHNRAPRTETLSDQWKREQQEQQLEQLRQQNLSEIKTLDDNQINWLKGRS